jgi:hypothetical protein
MRREVVPALVGFLVGAAALAGGQGDEALRERLQELQEAVAKAMVEGGAGAAELPPGDGRGQELAIFPVGDLAVPVPDHLPPRPRTAPSDEGWVFAAVAEEGLLPFGTVEELMELVRASVEPWAWETASISISRHRLLVLHRPAVSREIGRFLDGDLRPRAHGCVTVEAEVVDAERRVLAVRATGLLGQRFLAWHGRQVAFLGDPEVEVAQESSVSDPFADVVQAGGCLSVRASAGEDPARLVLDLDFRHDALREVRQQETEQGGELDLPLVEEESCRAVLTVRDGEWTVVGAGGKPGRVLRVRATRLPRGGP